MKKQFNIHLAIYGMVLMAGILCMSFSSNTGNSTRETRDIKDFTKISLALAADVYIKQGNTYLVEVEASDKDLPEILTEVSGDKLTIKTRNWTSNIRDKVTLYITMPKLKGLSVAGSGNIITKSGIKGDDMDLSVSGSGSIKMDDLMITRMDATITGSGSVKVAGNKEADKLKLTITGSGSFTGNGLQFGNVGVTITGSGSAKVYAGKELHTNITGSGSVLYTGNPQVDANSTGSGRTKRMD